MVHFNLPAVPEKSRSEKEKPGVFCGLSHRFFVLAHEGTHSWVMASHSLPVSWASAALGGAAAPVMVEPGLRWRGRGGNRGSGGYDPERQGNWLSSLSRITNGRLLVSP
jgi:hypothetical protein